MTIAAEVNRDYVGKTAPGDEYLVDITFTMNSWDNSEMITLPYEIVLTLGKTP
jgi:hypothetical protein